MSIAMAQLLSAGETSDELNRIKRLDRIRLLSKVMAAGCLVTPVLLTAAMLFYWSVTPSHALLGQAGLAGAIPVDIGVVVRGLAFVISMIPLSALIYGLLNAFRCFTAFTEGHIFSIETVSRLKVFSIAVAASALLKPLSGGALSILLSWNAAQGATKLVLNVGSDTLLTLIFAGTVAVIAWVLAEATVISDENEMFV